MKIPEGFEYHRDVPAEWTDDLARLTPKSEQVTWLQLVWMAGDPWQPVQRWAIYEMTPVRVWWEKIRKQQQKGAKLFEIFHWGLLQEFEGPDPRTMGRYDSVMQQFVSEAVITKQEWDLFRAHQAIPMLYWIIQGEHGGHKRRFSDYEQKVMRFAGLPTDPPAPGDLPYAPFDRRVLDQLAHRDRLKQAQGKLSGQSDERSTQMQELRGQLVKWLTEQMEDVLSDHKIDLDGVPRSDTDPTEMIERETQNFIDTGHTNQAA